MPYNGGVEDSLSDRKVKQKQKNIFLYNNGAKQHNKASGNGTTEV